jgi:hypothetical protein
LNEGEEARHGQQAGADGSPGTEVQAFLQGLKHSRKDAVEAVREVISFGFWFGDDSFSEPAFYAYTAPEPDGLAGEPLQPDAGQWVARNGSHLAVLRYDDARAGDDPRATVLDFYESAYQAGARLAGWDIQRLACPGGITDPALGWHQS